MIKNENTKLSTFCNRALADFEYADDVEIEFKSFLLQPDAAHDPDKNYRETVGGIKSMPMEKGKARKGKEFFEKFYAAHFVDGELLSDPETIVPLSEKINHDGDAILQTGGLTNYIGWINIK